MVVALEHLRLALEHLVRPAGLSARLEYRRQDGIDDGWAYWRHLYARPASFRPLRRRLSGVLELFHPLAGRRRARPEDLRHAAILRREAGSGMRLLVDSMLSRAGIGVPTAMELGSTEALKHAALARSDATASPVSRPCVRHRPH